MKSKIAVWILLLSLGRSHAGGTPPEGLGSALAQAGALVGYGRYLGLALELSDSVGRLGGLRQEMLDHSRNCQERRDYSCPIWTKGQPLLQMVSMGIDIVEPWRRQASARLGREPQEITEAELATLSERVGLARLIYARAEQYRGDNDLGPPVRVYRGGRLAP